MAVKFNKRKAKKKLYSYRERRNFHTERMRKGFAHGGKLNAKESYSAGFVHAFSDSSTNSRVSEQCDLKSFEKGEKACFRSLNKAMNYKH